MPPCLVCFLSSSTINLHSFVPALVFDNFHSLTNSNNSNQLPQPTNQTNLQPSKCSSTLSPSSPPWPLLPPLSRTSSHSSTSSILEKVTLSSNQTETNNLSVPSTSPFASRPLSLPQPHPLECQPHPLDPQLHLVLELLDPPA